MGEEGFTDDFRQALAGGKYTGWACDLSADTLSALLWAIGEIGARVQVPHIEARRAGGRSYVSLSAECQGSCERVKVALDVIFRIAAREPVLCTELSTKLHEAITRGPIAESQ